MRRRIRAGRFHSALTANIGDQMSEPRWHDSDPRPPFGSAPGPGFRPARNVPEPPTGGYRRLGDGKPAAWEEPGWYREDPEQARNRAAQDRSAQDWRIQDRSAQDRLGAEPSALR